MRRVLVLVLFTVALAGGCGRGESPLNVDDRRFIEAMVALRQAAQESASDATSFAAIKVGVLSKQGVTEEELRAYIQTHAHDLERLAMVWESINVRLARTVTHE